MKIMLIVVLLLIVSALISCGGGSPALENTNWKLESYGEGNNLKTGIEGTAVTAQFDGKGQVKETASCNSYFGSYELKGDSLTIINVGSTKMFCTSPAGVMQQEQEYLTALGEAESYLINGRVLQIACSGNRFLVFRAE